MVCGIMRTEPRTARKRAPGLIEPGVAYTLVEFLKRIDCGDATWRVIRRRIKLRRVGRRVYVLGQDWLAYLESIDAAEPIESTSPQRSRKRRNGAGTAPDGLLAGEQEARLASA